jgi:hypothetical protein
MTYECVASDEFASPEFPRASRKFLAGAFPGIVALALSGLSGAWVLHKSPMPRIAAPEIVRAPAAASAAITAAPKPPVAASPYGGLFDPGFSVGSAQFLPARPPSAGARVSKAAPIQTAAADPYGVLFDPGFSAGSAEFSAAQAPAAPPAPVAPAASVATPAPENAPAPPAASPLIGEGAPLPPSRPVEFALPANPPAAARRFARDGRGAPPAAAAPDNRNFLEKLFGLGQPAAPALSYASAQSSALGASRSDLSAARRDLNAGRGDASGPLARYDGFTAVYDLAAHTVYLPNGTRLEAHSGLGDRLDDPGHVNERNRGATPPHVYELEAREELFHGVQALRLNPVGGGDVFGRAGFLAHSYMLGPNGDSNGCVSFRNYDAFLQAFQNGQVKRLAVVARLD